MDFYFKSLFKIQIIRKILHPRPKSIKLIKLNYYFQSFPLRVTHYSLLENLLNQNSFDWLYSCLEPKCREASMSIRQLKPVVKHTHIFYCYFYGHDFLLFYDHSSDEKLLLLLFDFCFLILCTKWTRVKQKRS